MYTADAVLHHARFFNASLRYVVIFGTLAEAVDYVAVAISQVSTSSRLSHTHNVLQYCDVWLQETTHVCYSHVRTSF